jgi:hypothetical protein
MGHPGRNGGRSDSPDQLSHGPPPNCWYCQRPNAYGTATLGGRVGSTTKINVCSTGQGCQDGRIFHGPAGPPPHRPGQPCDWCAKDERPRRSRNERRRS